MFETIGMEAGQERVYLALLSMGSEVHPGELARAVDVPAHELDRILGALAGGGLVHTAADDGSVRAVPPDIALTRQLVDRIDELRRMHLQLAKLAHELPDPAIPVDGPGATETLRGREAIAGRYHQLQRSAREGIRSLAGGPAIAVPAEENAGQREALAAGVRYQVVYERALLDPDVADAPMLLEQWAALGEEMRVAAEVPFKLVIIDDRQALLVPRTQPYAEPIAVHVRFGPIVGALIWAFEKVWESALPVPTALLTPSPGPLSDEDRRLLSLLLAGYTDGAIASQLGVSLRTVQRRVGHLLELAGVRTRLQLGWQAARLKWI
ncbi:helix-turn-helix transcriptional regulator [Agromyces archimandritae]|uniref:HTH luxR-type domain-containing protein n=1 Tax=Agromyces archimandritae TaxID=2781962 RepID=A0A975IP73_9MICO|nr:LuxR family transcriptional regulator [Agromyces archimandritae]QTX05348.1 hypothetical protein G127AT_03730 [Agromyces archimandritae]